MVSGFEIALFISSEIEDQSVFIRHTRMENIVAIGFDPKNQPAVKKWSFLLMRNTKEVTVFISTMGEHSG